MKRSSPGCAVRKILLFPLVALAILFALPVLAGERQEDPDEATVRDIAQGLRCAVCQNQSVYESNSDLAKDMLKVIRQKVRDGGDSAEVRQYFHDRYGDYIYLEPTRQGSNLILWAGPFLFLLGGGVLLGVALRRWHRARLSGQSPVGSVSPALSEKSGTTAKKGGRDGAVQHKGGTDADDRQQRIQRELEQVD
ncbi:MAG: cytochrome c-type biogenesis protein CcmH [Magnetococcales bacterium]|nr:cytochrome c-type biogenesis protein CcmH [Magnetococcales bacterium]MBF0321556.1 cytochrome c-type biogenesis protein CcmH [Magnetococcales bacterium]